MESQPIFDQVDRRPHVLLPLPSCNAKMFAKQFYKALSSHVFKTRPKYVIELAFFSPQNDYAYDQMMELHRQNQGVQQRLSLLRLPSGGKQFVASLPRFVVLPFEPRFYRSFQEHSIFKTFLLANAFKQLLREQNWDFREHPVTRELKKRVQFVFAGFDEDVWADTDYAKASEKLQRKIVVDVRQKIQFWLVYWKDFNALQAVDQACELFQ